MQTIGLTGGIGSGKSTIARILKQMGYPVYIADTEASRLMNNHPGIRADILARFGDTIYVDHLFLNKPLLAQIIFEDSQALEDINRIVHPRVMEDFQHWSEQQKSDLVFFESAILFETGLNTFFRHVICVTASEETRLARVMSRDNTTPEKVKERIRNQMQETEKCSQSDFIIYNDNNHMVLEQVLEIVQKLTKKNHEQTDQHL